MDCAPLCHTTCSNFGHNSPCPVVCVRGCGCPQGMVIDEDQRRCVMPLQCPNKSMLASMLALVSNYNTVIICFLICQDSLHWFYMSVTSMQCWASYFFLK